MRCRQGSAGGNLAARLQASPYGHLLMTTTGAITGSWSFPSTRRWSRDCNRPLRHRWTVPAKKDLASIGAGPKERNSLLSSSGRRSIEQNHIICTNPECYVNPVRDVWLFTVADYAIARLVCN